MHFYKGNLKKALKNIFPELGPHLAKFNSPKRMHFLTAPSSFRLPSLLRHLVAYSHTSIVGRYWDEVGNRRKLMIAYARERGKDPVDPAFWSSVTAREFRDWKV